VPDFVTAGLLCGRENLSIKGGFKNRTFIYQIIPRCIENLNENDIKV
jgi:hypothetical protein